MASTQTRRAHLTALIAALGLGTTGQARAADGRFDGTWTGILAAGANRLTLQLVIAGDTVTMISVDQGGARIQASDVAITSDRITLGFSGVGARFEGRLSDDRHIDGVFTQGMAVRMRFTRGEIADPLPDSATADSNAIITTPKLNQIGFPPAATKQFAITVTPDKPLTAFDIVDDGGQVVFNGKLGNRIFDVRQSAGEYAMCGDFSPFARPGRYRVKAGDGLSHPFVIGDGVYRDVLHDAARCFYLIRANVDIDDARTGVKHKAGHAGDAAVTVDGHTRDLSGGWYNAGDFGKYTHMHALSVSHMLRLYELRPDVAKLSLDIPVQYAGLPDLLQTARWGLDWLLRMQNADGSVLHKVDSQPVLTWGKLPADDPAPRAAMAASSIDAGVFVGVMGHASRVFASLDAPFAATCQAAARSAWRWLSQHPDVGHSDAYYLDPDARQEVLWARCEIAILDGVDNSRIGLPEMGVVPFYWPTPQVLGLMSLALRGHAQARSMIVAGARQIAARTQGDAYGLSALAETYSWGSNEMALNAAVVCLYADRLAPDANLATAAQGIFDYVLGRNSLDHSFVTAHGARPTQRPFHWICNMQNIAIPGWASGGANGQAGAADALLKAVIERGTPPAKCFVDACQNEGSYASNEGETSENAALVFVAGMLG
ncbi:glycoside hydrolase family 9 protein [Asticcacaulis sp. 201]|uniref:glycoside hydrolase family 9 protein n=1 Tax=Asticcacaulis sp. 201 TaxID=3028787 RepID=UPI0029165A8D|nr:glycoside hydrolase family 9 protein [Asticcacaulis sp. 201]MDV6330065.1 glycoside hydrolase family 9 protein [Asticcacaulis sp. 201]